MVFEFLKYFPCFVEIRLLSVMKELSSFSKTLSGLGLMIQRDSSLNSTLTPIHTSRTLS